MADNEKDIRKRVEEELDKIRPRLQMDGGDVTLVAIEDNVVKVKLEGACKGCPMSAITLQMGVEQMLKKAIPQIKSVEAVNTD
jgi:Fe-S cluster biogenesis protein NfuA